MTVVSEQEHEAELRVPGSGHGWRQGDGRSDASGHGGSCRIIAGTAARRKPARPAT